MPEQKSVGVLGGLGPLATVEFMRTVLRLTPIAAERDHLRMIVDCNPKVPDINASALTGGTEPVAELAAGMRRLERAGADFIVMVCNAAHVFEPQLRASVAVPFISMIDVTVARIVESLKEVSCVGVLATDGGLASDVYQAALRRRGIKPVQLDGADLSAFMGTIARIKKGDLAESSRAALLRSIEALAQDGAQAVILGCSEVGLVVSQRDCAQLLFDPTECLAAATVRAALTSD